MDTGLELTVEERMRTMSADEAVKMVRELCAQLGSDPESFHGNIWPGNVRFDWEGKAVLGERLDTPASERAAEQVEFVAPEFFWDGSGSAAADVYSLGLMLYAACNGGYMPFQPKGGALTDKDRSGALRKRMKGEKVMAPAGMSRELRAVVRKALAFEPEKRYLSAAELLKALGETDEALPAPDADVAEAVPAEEAAAAAAAGIAAGELIDDSPAAEDIPAEIEVMPETNEAYAPEMYDAFDADAAVSETPETEVAAEEAPEAESVETTPDGTPETEPAPAEQKRYTVQKDFEKGAARKAPSAAPATMRRRKKRVSPLIIVLCIAAVAVIGAVAWGFLGAEKPQPEEDQTTVSEPFVMLPAEPTPEATEAPKADETDDKDDAEDEADGEEGEETDGETVTGSESIDGKTVSPVSDTVYVTGSGVNLRSGPSTTYDIERTLARGTELTRTGTVSGWSQVWYEGEEYYVSNSLISATNPNGTSTGDGKSDDGKTTESADTGTTGSTGTAGGSTGTGTNGSATTGGTATTGSGAAVYTPATVTATRDIVTVTSKANLRSGAGTNNSIVDVVDVGTILQRTGTISGWSRVIHNGRELYIHDSLISAVSASTVTEAVGTLKITSDSNVRAGAGTGYSILGVVKVGTKLPITGLVDGKWYRVSYDGKDGYVNRNLISVLDFALVNDASGTVKVTQNANVRSGPGTDYDVLGEAAADDTLTVTGHTDTNWYQVTFGDKTGYIAGNLVEKAD